MKIEFDENKSAANKDKHGIDFDEARSLWYDPDLLEIPAKTVQDENRYLVIGKIENNKLSRKWSVLIVRVENHPVHCRIRVKSCPYNISFIRRVMKKADKKELSNACNSN